MTFLELGRLSLIEQTVDDEQVQWLCSMLRDSERCRTVTVVAERIDFPAPMFFLLKLPNDMAEPHPEAVKRIEENWASNFNGPPPAPLIILHPGCELVLQADVSDIPDAAVEAERERIALLADELGAVYDTREDDPVHGPGTVVSCHEFADAIRNRK